MPATAGVRSTLVLIVTTVVLAATCAPACHAAHNITAILSGRRDLAVTGLADDINGRNTITVLAHMAPLKARGLSRETLRHVLSLHVLVDYDDDAKQRRLPCRRLRGRVHAVPGLGRRARERRGGRVAFVPQDDDDTGSSAVFYVRSVLETPYNISVLQVSGVISSPAAAAGPSRRNVSDVMSKNGCGRFAGLVAATGDAAATFEEKANHGGGGGITFFCPADKAVKAFQPTFDRTALRRRPDRGGAVPRHAGALLHAGAQGRRTRPAHDGHARRGQDRIGLGGST